MNAATNSMRVNAREVKFELKDGELEKLSIDEMQFLLETFQTIGGLLGEKCMSSRLEKSHGTHTVLSNGGELLSRLVDDVFDGMVESILATANAVHIEEDNLEDVERRAWLNMHYYASSYIDDFGEIALIAATQLRAVTQASDYRNNVRLRGSK